jgi:hypothetical protein
MQINTKIDRGYRIRSIVYNSKSKKITNILLLQKRSYLFPNLILVSLYLDNTVMVFCFVQKCFLDNTRVRIFIFLSRRAQFFFPEFNIRLYDKNSESDIFFFLHQNQNIFFSNIGNQNIFGRICMSIYMYMYI